MGSVRVKLNLAGIKEVFADPGVQAELRRRAEAIATEADSLMPEGGYERAKHHVVMDSVTSRGNPAVAVATATNEAKAMQAKHSTLTKALDAGRG